MERLIDFLNHGLFPFTGRTADVERLTAFWRGTFDAQELRAALLIGEAGVGKSRLLDETLPRIVAAGGAAVHAKLVPESTTSVLPLIAQGLWYSEAARRLLKGEPEPTHMGVAGALRRIARLRPTLLVLEDIHLLSGEALREFSLLLEAISDESISLLAMARPVDLPARAALERALVDEMELAGLGPDGLAELWLKLFEVTAEEEIVARLHEATNGNPLALRSALRSAIKSKTLAPDPATGRWRVHLAPEEFGRSLRKNIDLLIEGMAVHLTDEERHAAAMLATLGEVFEPESARFFLPEAGRMIEPLTFKGIVAPIPVATPLRGPASGTALTFTHTLLHQYLSTSEPPSVPDLTRLVAERLPIFSTLPFQFIARGELSGMVETPVVIRAIHESVDISLHLDAGSDWTLASEILKSAWRLFEQLDGAGGRRTILEAELLNRTLSWLRRSNDNDEFDRHLARMLEITEPGGDGDDEELLRFRLRAFRHLHSRCAASDYPRCRDVWERVERLIERAPLLFGADVHIHYLEEVARAAQLLPDPAMLRLVEERLDRITTSPILPDDMKEMARERVAHALLQLFDTEEELARKMALLRELPRRIDGSNASLVLNQIALLETTGWMEEALAEATDSLQRFRKFGLMRNAAHVELISLCARAALGVDFAQIERDAVRLGSSPGYSSSPRFRSHIGIYLTKIGMLAGKLEWTRRIIAAFGADGTLFWPEGNLLLAREDGTMAEAVEALPQNEEPFATLRLLARAIAAGEESAPYAASLLARPLLRLDDLLMLRVILTVIGQRRVEGERRALVRALAWLEERRLASLMASFLEDFASRLPKKEASAWRGRLRALTSERPVGAAEPEAKLRISMLGTIAVSDADGRMQPIRGARVRAMLGLLVAARMVREPLTHREYCRLAAGGEVEPELARKTANMAVVRLREAVGADTVLTGEETHHLNLDRVSVDLLEAQALIDESREALRRRALLRAFPTLKRALELTHGEVPFPGLYDDFFEAIRDDFEFTLRTTVIDVARALLRESDAASAGEILSLAFDGMPDDEEIMELLHETLAAVGKRADAERVRMRAEEALEPAERL